MTRPIVVLGAGLAGLTCARLLAVRGHRIVVVDCRRGPSPTVVLNEMAVMLLREIWGPDVVEGGQVLTERIVRWGADADPESVRQNSVVMSADSLVSRLRAMLPRSVTVAEGPGPPATGWRVTAAATGGTAGLTRSLGDRVILAADVRQTRDADSHVARMEATSAGWVFLAPTGGGRGMLQAMVPVPPVDPAAKLAEVVAGARLLHRWVPELPGTARVWVAAPRIREPLCGPHRLAIGDAAMRLDPVGGYGVAYALRQAILAAAVIEHPDTTGVLEHYDRRLRQAFVDHLRVCVGFYETAFRSLEWSAEIEPMRRAIAVHREVPFRYRLRSTA